MVERILVLEDTPSQLRDLKTSGLPPLSFEAVDVNRAHAHESLVFSKQKVLPALIIVDFFQYTPAHIQLLRTMCGNRPHLPMVVLVPFGDVELRQRLKAIGVADILSKPFEVDVLQRCVALQLQLQRMGHLIARLERQVSGHVGFADIIGYSAAIRQCVVLAERSAATPVVLLGGDVGTGKTLLARAMHSAARMGQAFVMVDCEQLSSDMAEASIFSTYDGKRVQAEGGTLFLREVGVLPHVLQHRLVQQLQDKKASVHVICSSTLPLEKLVREGVFNPVFAKFLQQCVIAMPTLNDRREDIGLLAQHFLAMHTARNNRFISRFSEDALQLLANSEWRGNVAQLSNLVFRCTMLCNQSVIDAGTLRLVQQLEPVHYAQQGALLHGNMPSIVDAQGKIKKLKSIEDDAIRYALSHFGGSMTKAAASLGIGRSTLYRRMVGNENVAQMARANHNTRPMMRISSTDFS